MIKLYFNYSKSGKAIADHKCKDFIMEAIEKAKVETKPLAIAVSTKNIFEELNNIREFEIGIGIMLNGKKLDGSLYKQLITFYGEIV